MFQFSRFQKVNYLKAKLIYFKVIAVDALAQEQSIQATF
jgi:hypothetical protein